MTWGIALDTRAGRHARVKSVTFVTFDRAVLSEGLSVNANIGNIRRAEPDGTPGAVRGRRGVNPRRRSLALLLAGGARFRRRLNMKKAGP